MAIPYGTEVYKLDHSHVTGWGVRYSDSELNLSLEGPVSKVIFDEEGSGQLETILLSTAETGFEVENVKRLIGEKRKPENWRVGEALAESYLIDHRNCFFPWPSSRDQKKESSSLPGTDLVGFQKTDNPGSRFAFGEVKTSKHKEYPPSVMHGKHGLRKQLEDLCGNERIRDWLVKYLGLRAKDSSWEQAFKDSSKRYLGNSGDVSLFGFMVRDVAPHEDDLRTRTEKLAKSSTPPISIELLALYLPEGSIENLSSKVTKANIEGH